MRRNTFQQILLPTGEPTMALFIALNQIAERVQEKQTSP